MAFNEKFKYKDAFADIYDVWGRRTPSFEVHYQKEVISILSDYGHGTTKNSEDKAKVLGAGYEELIMAFFIGLYSNKMLPFEEYADIKDTGQPIQFWGNLDSKTRRRAYPKLREYMFVALVARTPDIDWIALDKGKRTVNECVALLMDTMEQYINYGLSVIREKLQEDESYFYSKSSFLDIFKELTHPKVKVEKIISDDIPESLD
jgi:hypothetical protein